MVTLVPVSDARPRLEKATLTKMRPMLGALGPTIGRIEFQFNPKELSLTKAARWERRPVRGARSAPRAEFTGVEPRSTTIEMFFDKSMEPGADVWPQVRELYSCLNPLPDSISSGRPSPPFVVFGWGGAESYTAFVKSVNVRYTLFHADGRPLRAVAQVTLDEVEIPDFGQNPTSGGINGHRVRHLVQGDSLASIAYQEYGTAAKWRTLADANGIDDPLRVLPGTTILVPSPEVV